MSGVGEAFVIALGRAQDPALRRLHRLQRADREDILATAMAWCWEHRTSYNISIPLETWFDSAVRDAFKAWRRGERKHAAEALEAIQTADDTADDTAAVAEVQSAVEALVRGLTDTEQEIAKLRVAGYSRRAIERELGLNRRDVSQALRKLKRLRGLVPEPNELKRAVRTDRPPDSDDDRTEPTAIDRAVEHYLRPAARSNEQPPYGGDYQPRARQYVAAEDVRGNACVHGQIKDYEENVPRRRLRTGAWYDESWHTPEVECNE